MIGWALERLRAGGPVIMVGDIGPGGQADVCIAAEKTTPDAVTFLVGEVRGLVVVALHEEKMRRLGIPLLGDKRQAGGRPPYGASVEAREGVTTGISAPDRARTIRLLAAEPARPEEIVMPGHVITVQARDGGVLARLAVPEGAVDLVRLAGMRPAAVLCTLLRADGGLATGDDIQDFAARHHLPLISVSEVLAHRLRTESIVVRVAEEAVETRHGNFHAVVYRNRVDQSQHLALVRGPLPPASPVPVRVHSQCLTGDVFGSQRCDCGDQLRLALDYIARAAHGVLVYLHQEGRGIGLANKIRAYALQDQGRDTVEANLELGFQEDLRDYGIAAQILRDLAVREVRLLTNNPQKIHGLESYGVAVVERIPLEVEPHAGNAGYLRTKREKLGHLLSVVKGAD